MTYSTDFIQFNLDHPEVLQELIRRARQAKAQGFTRFGLRTIWESTRWHFAMERDSRSPWKLNDHLCPEFSRWMMQNNEDLKDFFETRKSKGEQS